MGAIARLDEIKVKLCDMTLAFYYCNKREIEISAKEILKR